MTDEAVTNEYFILGCKAMVKSHTYSVSATLVEENDGDSIVSYCICISGQSDPLRECIMTKTTFGLK